jgi:hypothetical protein
MIKERVPAKVQVLNEDAQFFVQANSCTCSLFACPRKEQPKQQPQATDIEQRQKELLLRVQQMTPDTIAKLPPDQQKQVIKLRQQLGIQ